eukprot:6316292-Amphidinium_carterae.1
MFVAMTQGKLPVPRYWSQDQIYLPAAETVTLNNNQGGAQRLGQQDAFMHFHMTCEGPFETRAIQSGNNKTSESPLSLLHCDWNNSPTNQELGYPSTGNDKCYEHWLAKLCPRTRR